MYVYDMFIYLHTCYIHIHLMLSNKLMINQDLKIPRILRFRVQSILFKNKFQHNRTVSSELA